MIPGATGHHITAGTLKKSGDKPLFRVQASVPET